MRKFIYVKLTPDVKNKYEMIDNELKEKILYYICFNDNIEKKGNIPSKLNLKSFGKEILHFYRILDDLVEKEELLTYIDKAEEYIQPTTKGMDVYRGGGYLNWVTKLNNEKIQKEKSISNKDQLIELQILKLEQELEGKYLKFQKELKEKQKEFFETSSKRNKWQLWYFILVGIISLLALFKSMGWIF